MDDTALHLALFAINKGQFFLSEFSHFSPLTFYFKVQSKLYIPLEKLWKLEKHLVLSVQWCSMGIAQIFSIHSRFRRVFILLLLLLLFIQLYFVPCGRILGIFYSEQPLPRSPHCIETVIVVANVTLLTRTLDFHGWREWKHMYRQPPFSFLPPTLNHYNFGMYQVYNIDKKKC